MELCVAYMCRLAHVLSEGTLRPSAIYFRHAPVGSSAQYRQHLGQLPRFRAAFDGIAIDPLAWRQPMPRHNRLLQRFVERFLLDTSPGSETGVANQVRNILGNLMRVGLADLPAVARALGQHPRTLQRRLRAEGAVFEDLRDAARKAWVGQLLAQPGLSLGHIAQLLGYADQSVLTRACQRWFGASPQRLRRGVQTPEALTGSGR
jgi:AraC-like DNA-binding protein